MDITQVREINKVYMEKIEEEDFENSLSVDIFNASTEIINVEPLMGSELDILSVGEYTRRYNSKMRELVELLKMDTSIFIGGY